MTVAANGIRCWFSLCGRMASSQERRKGGREQTKNGAKHYHDRTDVNLFPKHLVGKFPPKNQFLGDQMFGIVSQAET